MAGQERQRYKPAGIKGYKNPKVTKWTLTITGGHYSPFPSSQAGESGRLWAQSADSISSFSFLRKTPTRCQAALGQRMFVCFYLKGFYCGGRAHATERPHRASPPAVRDGDLTAFQMRSKLRVASRVPRGPLRHDVIRWLHRPLPQLGDLLDGTELARLIYDAGGLTGSTTTPHPDRPSRRETLRTFHSSDPAWLHKPNSPVLLTKGTNPLSQPILKLLTITPFLLSVSRFSVAVFTSCWAIIWPQITSTNLA